jgi:quinoprotein glucose dehydrogenase
MTHWTLRVAPALLLACCAAHAQRSPDRSGEWRAYGRDALGSRHSPLAEITRENVKSLTVAWTFHTGELLPDSAAAHGTSFETTPLVIDGTMYITTPLGRVIALDPTTGRERWRFNPDVNRKLNFGDFTNRGVSYWRGRGSGRCTARLFIGTIDARLIALDAADGKPCTDFGEQGTVQLRRALRNAPFETEEYEVTSPPAIIGDRLVVGSAVADNNRINAASGEVRAFDVRSGVHLWTWHSIPTDSTDPAWRTWQGPNAHSTGAANAWSVLAADSTRGLVFVPTGSASPDYYGGERLGDNRYANSIVALRIADGTVAWHFQVVHHDLWDYDVASPPALVTIKKDGREIPVVLQATKSGQLFVLHRDTGIPVFPVEERPVPASDVPGERASPTQPFNTVLPALSPQRLTPEMVWGPTPADLQACRDRIAPLRNEGIYTPPSERGTVAMPSNIGGAHWGGVTFDPARQLAIIPVNRLVAEVQLLPRDRVQARREVDASQRVSGVQYTNMRGTPYVMRRSIMRGPSGAPCTAPPFGALVAIDLSTGRKAWEVPLGDWRVGASAGSTPVGSPNLGGPMSTDGGIVFIGATIDPVFRAFDTTTGAILWQAPLPAGAKATPMTYRASGRQYVVIAAGGDGSTFGTSDALIAFALPSR